MTTQELGDHTAFKHIQSDSLIIMKENRMEAMGDTQMLADVYAARQEVSHPNLACLIEYKVDQELKLPMPE